MAALILVNLQNDFMPGGALDIQRADQVLSVANWLMGHFKLVVSIQDWHPANHISFAANHPWRKPWQQIKIDGHEQLLWPIHGVQESFGAEPANGLKTEKISRVFYKGINPKTDQYSAFFDNRHEEASELGEFLRQEQIDTVAVMGVPLEYDVRYTALDARELGFQTRIILDGCASLNLQDNDREKALLDMKHNGIALVESAQWIDSQP